MEESESQAESYVEQVTDKHFQDMKGTHRRSTESGEGIKLKGKQNFPIWKTSPQSGREIK